MGKCLITRLNASVDGDFSYYNAVRVIIRPGNNGFIPLSTTDEVRVRVLSDTGTIKSVSGAGEIIDTKTAVLREGGTALYPGITFNENDADIELLIDNKGSVIEFPNIVKVIGGINSMAYMDNLLRLYFVVRGSFSLSEVPRFPNVELLGLSTSNGSGSVKKLINENFTPDKLRTINLGLSSATYERFEDIFGFCTACTSLLIRNIGFVSIEGSIEEFVAKQRSAGRINAEMSIEFQNCSITFNGNILEYPEYKPKALSWTANTITIDGDTINA